jgi:hypothetical protein
MITAQTYHTDRFTRFARFLGVITVTLMLINVVMSARVAQDGLAIDALSDKQADLKTQIRDLEQQLFTKTSLNDLYQEAQVLGYTAPTTIVTVNTTVPVALKP